mgnify:CR=1 FL=1
MRDIIGLTKRLKHSVVNGIMEGEITELVYDSRRIEPGCCFVCIKGASFDGHDAAVEAVEKGAKLIVIEHDVPGLFLACKEIKESIEAGAKGDDSRQLPVVIKTDDTREALAVLSAAYFDHPAESLSVIGITGTKGKTTTTYMVKSILENADKKVGLIGTIETIIGDEHIPAVNTTPESYIIQRDFRRMVDAGIEVCVMEVSSQGLMMHRVDGFTFELGIFTNISPDHIGPNEHKDFDDYLRCKSMLFTKCRHGIANGDDEHLEKILKGHTCTISTYGLNEGNDLLAKNISLITGAGYLGVKYDVSGLESFEVEAHVPGIFSVYNTLTAIAICHHYGVAKETMQDALKKAHAKGRIEMIHVSDDFSLMIDYAHNAMALESLLSTLREYEPGRLVCLFGCGGNRSKLRRYEMGEVSGRLADLTVVTSDNPRDEEPMDIINDIIEGGMKKTDGEYVTIPDRKEAIRYCIENGQPGDVIVLAGKGHEDYQEIKGKKYPMDERVLIQEILSEMGGR